MTGQTINAVCEGSADVSKPESYRPSNGSEGEYFMGRFCYRCSKAGDDELGCDIVMNTMCFSVDDEEYPREWIYDTEGKPTCTAFEKVP